MTYMVSDILWGRMLSQLDKYERYNTYTALVRRYSATLHQTGRSCRPALCMVAVQNHQWQCYESKLDQFSAILKI